MSYLKIEDEQKGFTFDQILDADFLQWETTCRTSTQHPYRQLKTVGTTMWSSNYNYYIIETDCKHVIARCKK
jgi:hypothetical protein